CGSATESNDPMSASAASSAPSESNTATPPPQRPAPSVSGARLSKALIGGVAVVLFLGIAIAGLVHMVHRARQKAVDIETSLQTAGESSSSNLPSTTSPNKPATPDGAAVDEHSNLGPAPSPTMATASETAPAPGPISPAAATGDPAHDWALKYERTENGPEADLV